VSPGRPGPETEQSGRAQTPWGAVLIRWRSQTILSCRFEDDPPVTGTADAPSGPPDHGRAQAWLDRWLSDETHPGRGVAVDPGGSAFQRRVWSLLKDIPRGETASYRWVAETLGVPHGVRAVGAACGANPVALWIPCHRVVGSDGSLCGYRWGLQRKAALLAWESQRSLREGRTLGL